MLLISKSFYSKISYRQLFTDIKIPARTTPASCALLDRLHARPDLADLVSSVHLIGEGTPEGSLMDKPYPGPATLAMCSNIVHVHIDWPSIPPTIIETLPRQPVASLSVSGRLANSPWSVNELRLTILGLITSWSATLRTLEAPAWMSAGSHSLRAEARTAMLGSVETMRASPKIITLALLTDNWTISTGHLLLSCCAHSLVRLDLTGHSQAWAVVEQAAILSPPRLRHLLLPDGAWDQATPFLERLAQLHSISIGTVERYSDIVPLINQPFIKGKTLIVSMAAPKREEVQQSSEGIADLARSKEVKLVLRRL